MKTPPPPPAPHLRFAGLDGLRAIAVITVMLFHLSPGFVPGGYLGVDVFFVISGFLITALLLREHDRAGTIQLFDFWRRRARRLLPALGILLLVCCSLALLLGGNLLLDLGKQVLGATTFSSNWLSIAGERSYFTESTPELFRNLWSLAVEEQFYLLWPLAILLLLLIPKRFVRLTIVGGLAVGSALAMALIYIPGGDATRVYYGTDTHSFGLAIGAVLAIASRSWSVWPLAWPRWLRIILPLAGLASVGGLVALSLVMPADAPLVYQGGLLAVALLTAVAIAGATMPGSVLGRGLDVPPLRWIGERSYGLYLWHWPVFVLVIGFLPTWSRDGSAGWALGGIALAVTVLAAAVSYRFVEQPIRKNGFRATFRSWFSGWQTSTPRLVTGTLAVTLAVSLGVASAAAIATDPGK
ncbi:MAG TPA: acyltransferase, partial [Terrimesophilobacter sp.]|uniref:acyltransferase family protein n=1 Tax=Terrimesophilobacter sp. TaxID=2906435 RepID=UPI002F920115